MDLEDRLASVEVGRVDDDLTIESPGAEQSAIEHVGPVGRGQQDHARVGLEAVHLDQQLVERLLALVVDRAEMDAPLSADGVELVDEDEARGLGLGLLEQVADARGADADEHLDEIAAAQREERHLGLAGHGPRQQRLAGSGRPEQQNALGDLGAERRVALRVAAGNRRSPPARPWPRRSRPRRRR